MMENHWNLVLQLSHRGQNENEVYCHWPSRCLVCCSQQRESDQWSPKMLADTQDWLCTPWLNARVLWMWIFLIFFALLGVDTEWSILLGDKKNSFIWRRHDPFPCPRYHSWQNMFVLDYFKLPLSHWSIGHVKPSFTLVTIIDEVWAQNSKIIFTIT